MNVTVFVVRVWEKGIQRGTDTEYYCVCCEGLGRAIKRGTDAECYCVCCEGLAEGNKERN